MSYTSISEPANFYFNNGPDYNRAVNRSATASGASTAQRGAIIFRYLGPNVSGTAAPATGAVTTPVSQWPANLKSVETYFYDSPIATTPGACSRGRRARSSWFPARRRAPVPSAATFSTPAKR
jgi:hypothetical protein